MGDEAKQMNRLAREQMKARLLADILFDLQVCQLEGYDPSEYIGELLGEVERIAVGIRAGSEIPKWRHVCGKCASPISVFDTECRACGSKFDMAVPFERRLIDGS